MLRGIVEVAESIGASDIHLTVGKYAKFRVKGQLKEYRAGRKYTEKDILDLFQRLGLNMNLLDSDAGVDRGWSESNSRLRVHFYKTLNGLSVSIRLIPTEIPEFASLGLPEVMRGFIKEKNGLVIVTGPTGSGKSTTLASMINEINNTVSKKIVTVEDPIEFIYEEKRCSIEQREIGEHVPSFDLALKQAMRQDPDILLVGELRDLDTIENALRMAETGHLVFGTLHTRGAAESFTRIIDVFEGNKQSQIRTQLANVVKGIISQQLVYSSKLSQLVPVVEVLVMNSAVRGVVNGNGPMSNLKDIIQQNYLKVGSQTFGQSAVDLIKEGKLSLEDVEGIFNEDDMRRIRQNLTNR